MSTKKVLVTGACGLIGTELCKQLSKEGHVVFAVDSGFRFNKSPSCNTFIQVPIQEYVSTQPNQFDYIFHMGNINGTKYFYDIPNRLIENNIEADLAVFDYVKQNNNCKLIYASSSEIIADTKNFPTNEEKNLTLTNLHNPRWSYRLGKMIGENYLVNSNINYLILRFFNVFSEHSGKGHFIRDIVDKLHNKNFDLIGADETRCFCYVQDAVDAMLKIKDVQKEVVNIGSDEEIKILDAANIIARSINIKNVKWNIIKGLSGSAKRRKPDLTKLRKLYPEFTPMLFEDVLSTINLNHVDFKLSSC